MSLFRGFYNLPQPPMQGSYTIVQQFKGKSGSAWLAEHCFTEGEQSFMRAELHLVLKGNKALILDESEFPFLLDVLAKAKKLAEKRAEKFYSKKVPTTP